MMNGQVGQGDQEDQEDQGNSRLSSTGAKWLLSQPPLQYIEGLIEATSMPRPLAAMLASRDITKDKIKLWIDPKMRDLMPDPSCLADMDVASGRLADAVIAGEKIGIFGDYDVDGASAASVLHDVLTNLGLEVFIHIPHRFHEGYGPNLPALLGLKEAGCHLILTVDCGITANAPIAATVEAGVEVIIV